MNCFLVKNNDNNNVVLLKKFEILNKRLKLWYILNGIDVVNNTVIRV